MDRAEGSSQAQGGGRREGVLQHKLKTRERGSGWLPVANKLRANIPAVDITGRSIRDHFGMLVREHRIKMAKQEKVTGGEKELTEKEKLLEELMEICEKTEERVEEENEGKKQSVEREKAEAIEMRDRAMGRYGGTKKRAPDGQDNVKSKKWRRKSGDTFEWLREKCAMEKNWKRG